MPKAAPINPALCPANCHRLPSERLLSLTHGCWLPHNRRLRVTDARFFFFLTIKDCPGQDAHNTSCPVPAFFEGWLIWGLGSNQPPPPPIETKRIPQKLLSGTIVQRTEGHTLMSGRYSAVSFQLICRVSISSLARSCIASVCRR